MYDIVEITDNGPKFLAMFPNSEKAKNYLDYLIPKLFIGEYKLFVEQDGDSFDYLACGANFAVQFALNKKK